MKATQKQNKIFLVGFLLIAIAVAFTLLRPLFFRASEDNKISEKKINEEILKAGLITPGELVTKMKADEHPQIFDMRSSREFDEGHLAQSRNVMARSLDGKMLQSAGVSKSAEIILINQGDNVFETASAVNKLKAEGFERVKYLQGGIAEWRNQGLILVSNVVKELDRGKIKKITIEAVAIDMASGKDLLQFVDLRDEKTYRSGHIPGSINISSEDLESKAKELPTSKKIVLYAENDAQASVAAVVLFDLNYLNAYVLEGGIESWTGVGVELEHSN